MLPSPLHPALVHFPVVLMLFLPLVAIGALFAIRRGVAPLKAWAFPVGLAGLLAVSAFVAVETGESEEHRVDELVAKTAMDTHEEAGKRFMLFSGIVFAIMTVGLIRGGAGRAARAAGLAGALALTVAGVQVGHSGGRVVYGDAATPGLVGAAGAIAGEMPEGEREEGEHN